MVAVANNDLCPCAGSGPHRDKQMLLAKRRIQFGVTREGRCCRFDHDGASVPGLYHDQPHMLTRLGDDELEVSWDFHEDAAASLC